MRRRSPAALDQRVLLPCPACGSLRKDELDAPSYWKAHRDVERFAVPRDILRTAPVGQLPAAVMTGPDGTASVQFGNAHRGSTGDVGPGIVLHDASPNAQFNLVPGTAVVAAGGIVTFTVGVAGSPSNKTVPHQVAVCKLGIGPDDVVIANPNAIPINDPNCPVVGPSPPSPLAVVQKQFTEPGRYLVLCSLGPHFTEFKMYGWVNVH